MDELVDNWLRLNSQFANGEMALLIHRRMKHAAQTHIAAGFALFLVLRLVTHYGSCKITEIHPHSVSLSSGVDSSLYIFEYLTARAN